MTRWLALLLLICSFARPVEATTIKDKENGGIIILRSEYSFVMDSGNTETLVIVASARVIASAKARIASAEGPITFRLCSDKLDMRLRAATDSRLIGRLADGRRVMVVTRDYVEKHGLN